MAEIDPSALGAVFGNIKTFADYQKADQQFQMQKALQGQQLQTGQLDMATKQNVLATQVLSAATASAGQKLAAGQQPDASDQAAYDQGLATLKNMGIDTSNWSPNVAQGVQQTTAAKLSQSPLGPLIDAQLKSQSNALQGAVLSGVMPPTGTAGIGGAGLVQALLGGAGASPAAAHAATGTTSAPAAAPLPPPPAAAGSPAATPGMPAGNPGAINAVLQAATAGSPGGGAPSQAPAPPGGSPAPAAPIPQPAAPAPASPAPGGAGAALAPMLPDPAAAQFHDPGKTLAANQQAYNNALEAYKADPTVIAQQEQAKTLGQNLGKDAQSAASATAVFGKLQQNINALQNLNNSTQSDGILGVETEAGISNRFGGGKDATALAQWNQVNVQQTINELAQLVDSGQIRSNKAIVQLLADSAEIPASLNADGRAKMIANLQSELNNVVSASQNITNIQTGAPQVPYQPLAGAAATATQAGMTTPAMPNPGNIPMAQVNQLKTMIQNASTPADAVKARVYFDQVHGPGAAQLVLGQ